jgi:hypothetical protein
VRENDGYLQDVCSITSSARGRGSDREFAAVRLLDRDVAGPGALSSMFGP